MSWHEEVSGTERKLTDLSKETQQKYAEKMQSLKETLSPDKIISDDKVQTLKDMEKAIRLAFAEVGGRVFIKEHTHSTGNEVGKLYGLNIDGRIGSYTIGQSVFDFDNLPSKLNMLVEDLGLGYFRENEGKVNCTRNGFMNWCEDKGASLKPFVCTVEEYGGKKTDCRVFADTAEGAREKLIEQFPKCYVSPAMTMKEYNDSKAGTHNSIAQAQADNEETLDDEDEVSLEENDEIEI